MHGMGSIRQNVSWLRGTEFEISEYSLRLLVKQGAIPVRFIGKKALVYFPNVVSYLRCENGGDNPPLEM